jgi:uncharacterized protein
VGTLAESQAVLRQLSPTQDKVDRAVATAIETVTPSRVFVFGSWARGEARWDSDLDLAILVADTEAASLGLLRRELRRELQDIPMTIDLVLATESCARELAGSVNSIYYAILKEGRLVYEREQDTGRRSPAA